MRLKNLDLIVTVIIAALNIGWALLPSHIPAIGIILALPLVLVLPGYTLTQALFHKRSLDVPNRLLFSLGLSVANAILSGLLLNILPVGLKAISWAGLLGLLTIMFSLLVAYLRRGAAVNGARTPRARLSISGFILFGLATVIAVFSILYAALGVAQQPYPGFTQLWMLPAVQAGKNCAVRLGVRSFESTPVTYRLAMTVGGAGVTTWTSVVLAPQEEWNRLVPIPPVASDKVSVEAQLYRVYTPQTVYREVNLTLGGCPKLQVTPTPYPTLAPVYNGTIHDIRANITTKLSLTGIQQSAGNITGYLTVGSELQGSGSFRGMVTTTKQIQFTVTDGTGHAPFSFEALIDSDGTLTGSYCSLNQQGQCNLTSGRDGLWSVAPASP